MIDLSIPTCFGTCNLKCSPINSFDDDTNQNRESTCSQNKENRVEYVVENVPEAVESKGDGNQTLFERSVEVWDESLKYSESYSDDDSLTDTEENPRQVHETSNEPVKPKEEGEAEASILSSEKEQACLGDLLNENTTEENESTNTCPEERDEVAVNSESREEPHRDDGGRSEIKDIPDIDPAQSDEVVSEAKESPQPAIQQYMLRETFSYLTRETKPEVPKNSTRADILRSFIKRDQEIARRRQEALSKVRASHSQNLKNLPGKKAEYPSDYMTKVRNRAKNQMKNKGSIYSSRSSGRSLYKPDESPSKPTPIDKSKQREIIRSLTKKNREIAKKRQEHIQKARDRDNGYRGGRKLPGKKMAYPDPLSSHCPLSDDISVSSASSARSASARLERLYEKGKKDRRSDLEKSAKQKKAKEELEQRTKNSWPVGMMLFPAKRRGRTECTSSSKGTKTLP